MFGSYDAGTLEKVVSTTCGKRVTGAIVGSTSNIEDIVTSYQRAVAADPYNAKILKQLELYKDIEIFLKEYNSTNSSPPSFTGCILCNGGVSCPLCQMKNDFRDILMPKCMNNCNESSVLSTSQCLEDLINALLKAT